MMGMMATQATPGQGQQKRRSRNPFDATMEILIDMKREVLRIEDEEVRDIMLDAICNAGAKLFFNDLSPDEMETATTFHKTPEAIHEILRKQAKRKILDQD